MRQTFARGIITWVLCSSAFATVPVTLSAPSPAIESTYIADTSTTVTYTVTNNVPKSLPLTVSGISGSIARTTVSSDCGDTLPAGPSTCSVGITISPSILLVGSTINQTLQVGYGGRMALTSPITFTVQAPTPIYAYVTTALNTAEIDKFLLSNDGLLSTSSSALAASNSQHFGQMTFTWVSGVEYAYILDPNGAVYWCNVDANGSLINCSSTASLPSFSSWQARAIAFATFDALYAYVLDPGNNVVYQCSLDTLGNFSSCQTILSLPTLAAYGIAFSPDSNGIQHAYIADAGSGSGFGDALMCAMQVDGSFSACAQTPATGAPNWIPHGITFSYVNGTQYAYVADNGSGVPGHVYRCSLNSDGSFADSGCTQTPSNDSSLADWYPYYIAFQSVDTTTYAYVVNSSGSSVGNIYRCVVDSNGLFTDCVITPGTPPSSWQPSGIAFRPTWGF